MAKTSGLKISIQATKLATAGFVIPFMAVYTPSLMLQDGGAMAEAYGYPVEVVYILFKACLAIGLWGTAFVGFFLRPMSIVERLLAFAAGCLLVLAVPLTDEAGFFLAALVLGFHAWRARSAKAAGPAPVG